MVELEYFKICRGKGLNVGVEKNFPGCTLLRFRLPAIRAMKFYLLKKLK
jgi:hypothetical protein